MFVYFPAQKQSFVHTIVHPFLLPLALIQILLFNAFCTAQDSTPLERSRRSDQAQPGIQLLQYGPHAYQPRIADLHERIKKEEVDPYNIQQNPPSTETLPYAERSSTAFRHLRDLQAWWLLHSSSVDHQEPSPSDIASKVIPQPIEGTLSVSSETFSPLPLPSIPKQDLGPKTNSPRVAFPGSQWSEDKLVGSSPFIFSLEETYLAYDLNENDLLADRITLLPPVAIKPVKITDSMKTGTNPVKDLLSIWNDLDEILIVNERRTTATLSLSPPTALSPPTVLSESLITQPATKRNDDHLIPELPMDNKVIEISKLGSFDEVSPSVKRQASTSFTAERLAHAFLRLSTIRTFVERQISWEFRSQWQAFILHWNGDQDSPFTRLINPPSSVGAALLQRAGVDPSVLDLDMIMANSDRLNLRQ